MSAEPAAAKPERTPAAETRYTVFAQSEELVAQHGDSHLWRIEALVEGRDANKAIEKVVLEGRLPEGTTYFAVPASRVNMVRPTVRRDPKVVF